MLDPESLLYCYLQDFCWCQVPGRNCMNSWEWNESEKKNKPAPKKNNKRRLEHCRFHSPFKSEGCCVSSTWKNREKKPEVFSTCQLAHPKRPPYTLRWPRRVSAASVGQLPTTSLHDIGHAHRESDEKVVRHVMHLPGHIGLGFWSGFFGSLSNQQEDQFRLRLSATLKEWWKDQQTNPKRNQPFCWYPCNPRKRSQKSVVRGHVFVHLPWLLLRKSTTTLTFKWVIYNPNNALRTPESYPTFALFFLPLYGASSFRWFWHGIELRWRPYQ